ncbi:radical SAM protein [Butyrivibrio sp. NC3005]|uniref:radical SAM protein n=1 Tax=Butyrivibrio sp. NC3005 TaxID=1280685 RepID=UPI00041E5AD9|nr:radical SAM protein [Butyrivibrio sp. NC3005]
MFPRGALVYLTNACTMNCKHCGIVNNYTPSFLDDESFEAAMDLLTDMKCYIVAISGGDPILHPHCFDYIREIRSRGMLPVLGISGIELNDKIIGQIKKAEVGCVQVSLDGTNESENAIFRKKGSFAEIIKNIKLMQKVGIRVNIATCLAKENVSRLNEMLILFKELNAYQIKLQFWQNIDGNTEFHELSVSDKKDVYRKVKEFVDVNNVHGWANIDIAYKRKRAEDKFILYPDGNVYNMEKGLCIGNILKDFERIKTYYEK